MTNAVPKFDSSIQVIYDYLNNPQSGITILTVSQSLQSFRNTINLGWYSQLLQYDHLSYLTEIWNVLLQLLSDRIADNPGIRITLLKTIGALIFTLSPFIPFTVVSSFLTAIQNKPSNPHISIAIISCFCQLSKFVSPLKYESFISNSPIIQCFTDLRQLSTTNHQHQNYYIKYLPKVISMIEPINIEFQRFLLNALLKTFGEFPSISFIDSIVELFKQSINWQILFDDFLNYIKKKQGQWKLTLLMLCSKLLTIKETNLNLIKITKYIKTLLEQRLFELSLEILQSNPSFLEFEESCRTLAALSNHQKNFSEQFERIQNVFSKIDCPPYLKKFTYQLTTSINVLIPTENDQISIQTSKFMALPTFFNRNKTNEVLKQILDIYLNFVKSESIEVLINVIQSFSHLFKFISIEFLKDSIIKNELKTLITTFLNIKTSNFVQNSCILKLIKSIPIRIGNIIFDNYEKIVLEICFYFCFSEQTELNQSALETLRVLSKYRNISIIVSLIIKKIDFFDAFTIFKVCEILNEIIATIGLQSLNEIKYLLHPIYESLLFIYQTNDDILKTIQTASVVFKFFNHFNFEFGNQNELKVICFDLICRVFESYTGIDPQLQTISSSLKPITSLVDTDILTVSFNEQSNILAIIKHSIVFLHRLTNSTILNETYFVELLIRSIKLFPNEILTILQNSSSISFIENNSYQILLLDIMQTTNSVSIASKCLATASNTQLMKKQVLNYFQSISEPISSEHIMKIKMFGIAMKFVDEKLITSGEDKYIFCNYFEMIEEIYSEVCNYDSIESVFHPKIEVDQINENLFLFFKSTNQVEFVKTLDFHEWPIFNSTFVEFISNHQLELTPISINFSIFQNSSTDINQKYDEIINLTTNQIDSNNQSELKESMNQSNQQNQLKNIHTNKCDLEFNLNEIQIKFISQFWKMFDIEIIKSIYFHQYKYFKKYFNEESEQSIEVASTSFESIDIQKKNNQIRVNEELITPLSSLTPLIQLQQEIEDSYLSISLINNFFFFQPNFSNFHFNDTILNQMLDKVIKHQVYSMLYLIFEYSVKHSIQFDFQILKNFPVSNLCHYYSMISHIPSMKETAEFIKSIILKSMNQSIDMKEISQQFTSMNFNLLYKTKSILVNLNSLHTSINTVQQNDSNQPQNSLSKTIRKHSTFSILDTPYSVFSKPQQSQMKLDINSHFLLNSNDFIDNLKKIQNPVFFKSAENIRSLFYFLNNFFNQFIELNQTLFTYSNIELNNQFLNTLQKLTTFLIKKVEFLSDSNFNTFIQYPNKDHSFIYFLRLLEQFIFYLNSLNQLKSNFVDMTKPFFKTIPEFIFSMQESNLFLFSVIYKEIGRLIKHSIVFDDFIFDYTKLIPLINSITDNYGVFSFSSFFEMSALILLYSNNNSLTNILKYNDKSLIQITKINNSNTFVKIPSECMSSLRCLFIILNPSINLILYNQFYYVFYPTIVDVFRMFSNMKLQPLDSLLTNVVVKLLSSPEFNTFQNLVIPYLEQYAKEKLTPEDVSNFSVADKIVSIINKYKC